LQAAEKDAVDASTKRSHDEGAASLNSNQVLMLHSRLKIIQASTAQANKAALEVEKQRDELHTQIEEIEEELQPKRTHSDADDGDAHEILTEVDNWDLRDHHREGTRVQNRRNVQGMLACARARTWIPVE
jgi:predicted transcriptional regulator